MRYFIGKDGQQLGPFEARQVREQLVAGAISYDDLVWREGMPAWAPVRTEFPPPAAPPLPAPGGTPGLGAPVPPPAGGSPGNPFLNGGAASIAPDEGPMLASRGKRLGAFLLDIAVNLVAAAPGMVWMIKEFIALENSGRALPAEPDLAFFTEHVAGPLLTMLVPLLVVLVIQMWLLCARGQTLGKKWLRIRIVLLDGSPAGFVHAVLLRSMVMQLIAAIPLIGGAVTLVDPLLIFREDHRCLHDLIAGTAVVDA